MYVGKLFISEYISNYPMSISIQQDNGCISLEGTALRGKKLGSSVLKVTLYGCDLNGDGYYEYSPTSFAVRIETGISAWMIIAAAILACALAGYICVSILDRRERGEK